MSLTDFIIYAVFGRLIIWFLQRSPLSRVKFLFDLFNCDLCLGFWVYFILAFIWKADLGLTPYIIVLSEGITGAFTSLVMYVFRNGWQTLFSTVLLE